MNALLIKLAIGAAALAGGVILWNGYIGSVERAADTSGYERAKGEYTAAALRESQERAREGLRRLEKQEENQRAHNAEVERLRAAAARNAADADRVRKQSSAAAREWAARLADSPTAADLSAASAAIRVCTDLLGRADRRAGILAEYADASRAAGLKCERDYDALTAKP